MSLAVTERTPILLPQQRLRATWPAGPVHPELRLDENASLQSGAWFSALSEPLRHAIAFASAPAQHSACDASADQHDGGEKGGCKGRAARRRQRPLAKWLFDEPP